MLLSCKYILIYKFYKLHKCHDKEDIVSMSCLRFKNYPEVFILSFLPILFDMVFVENCILLYKKL